MGQISILEKFNILRDVISSSYIYLLLFGVIILLTVFFATTNKYNYYENKQIFIMTQVLILILLIAKFHESIYLMFDYLSQNVFVLVYFPNLAIYMFAIIITNVIMYVSVFSRKVIKVIKIINSVLYTIFNFLLVLFLGVVINNDLNVFEHSSIYNNTQAQIILELSGIIFSLWILYLVIYIIMKSYLVKEETYRFVKPISTYEKEEQYIPTSNINLKEREYITSNDNLFFDDDHEELNYDDVMSKIKTKEEFEKLQRLLIEYKNIHNTQSLKLEELNEIIERNIV